MSLTTYILGKIITEYGVSTVIDSARTISTTSKNIYNMLTNISDNGSWSSKKILELDIAVKLRIIENMLNEIDIENINSNAIPIALESISQIICSIENDINNIQEKIKHNNSLWVFKSLRSHNYEKEIKNLEFNQRILEGRLELFFKLISIKSELKIKTEINQNKNELRTQVIQNYLDNID